MDESTKITKLKTKDVAPRPGEMIKPGEIIGIPGMEGWSLADRRTWNLLLVNAWGDRLEDPTADFEITLQELRGLHDSNDRVRESLEKLQTTLIAARMPDGKTRTVQMLGGTDIDDDDRTDGVLKYDFHRKLVPLLRRSEIYARMEARVLASFTSKYALALYEALALRMNLHQSTEEITLAKLRQLLGVERGKLGEWHDLNRRAVAPAVQEVNGLSPFSVEIEPVKRGRKVERVRMVWAKKQPFSPAEQAATREVNRAKVGRRARLIGTVEEAAEPLPAFPHDGRIAHTAWAAIAREALPHPLRDLNSEGAAFAAWCEEFEIPLNSGSIEKTFRTWAAKRSPAAT